MQLLMSCYLNGCQNVMLQQLVLTFFEKIKIHEIFDDKLNFYDYKLKHFLFGANNTTYQTFMIFV